MSPGPIDERLMIRVSLVTTSLRLLTWCCVILLAVLSLLPAQEMVRTGFPGQFEHFIADAGSAAIAMVGYGLSRNWHADHWPTMFGVGLSGGIEKTSLISVMPEEKVAGRDAMPRNCET
jgi:hypothetical protein